MNLVTSCFFSLNINMPLENVDQFVRPNLGIELESNNMNNLGKSFLFIPIFVCRCQISMLHIFFFFSTNVKLANFGVKNFILNT